MGVSSTPALAVRVINHPVPGVPDAEPVYRLITTRLDAGRYPAAELAALYHERWGIETPVAEIKATPSSHVFCHRGQRIWYQRLPIPGE